MPAPDGPPLNSEPNDLERQYRLEKTLADRLRHASSDRRRGLYSQVYDEFFEAFPHLAGFSEHARQARASQVDLELQLLQPFLSRDIRFLEYGAGDGEVARLLAGGVRSAWAVDASQRLAQQASDPVNLEVLVSDGPPLDLPDRSIDLAYSCHFIEHLHPDDLPAHLQDALRLLRPGGRYVCVTPNRLLGPHDISKYFEKVASGFHLREYTHRELARAFRRAGFSKVSVLRQVGAPPRKGTTTPYLLAEAAAGLLPRSVRLRLFSVRRAPFRPFEQVKICAVSGQSEAW